MKNALFFVSRRVRIFSDICHRRELQLLKQKVLARNTDFALQVQPEVDQCGFISNRCTEGSLTTQYLRTAEKVEEQTIRLSHFRQSVLCSFLSLNSRVGPTGCRIKGLAAGSRGRVGKKLPSAAALARMKFRPFSSRLQFPAGCAVSPQA